MSYQIKQSTTAYPLVFFMTDSADHLAGKAGLTCTVKISKAGATGVSPSGSVTQIDSTNLPGWYQVAGNETDTDTLGPLILHATASGADATDMIYEVVAFDPQDSVRLGLTGLANAAPGAAGGLFIAGTNAATTVTTSFTTTFTGNLTGSIGSLGATAKTDASTAVLTTQMTEAYAADDTAPTLAQAMFLTMQSVGEVSISGTTLTVKKLDGSTTAASYTLNDATTPTSRTRAS